MTKFIEKFLSETFKEISKRNLISTLFWYVIDSKELTRKRIDTFLKEQIKNPNLELVEIAKSFAKLKNPDKIIIAILKYVYERVEYKRDIDNFKKIEYWADSYLTWLTKKDDCDGINGLIYILMRLASSEIINNCLFCMLCDTNPKDTAPFDHFALIYFSTKTGKWHSIDGTYYPDFTEIQNRKSFKLNDTRYSNISFIFNETTTWKFR